MKKFYRQEDGGLAAAEVVAALDSLGVVVDASAVRDYVRRGLVGALPVKRGKPGPGQAYRFHVRTPSQFFASYALVHNHCVDATFVSEAAAVAAAVEALSFDRDRVSAAIEADENSLRVLVQTLGLRSLFALEWLLCECDAIEGLSGENLDNRRMRICRLAPILAAAAYPMEG